MQKSDTLDSDITSLPKRPKPTRLSSTWPRETFNSNYYKVILNVTPYYFQSDISFEPSFEEDAAEIARRCVLSVRREIKQKLGDFHLRGKMLWSLKEPMAEERFKCSYINKEKEKGTLYDNILILRMTKKVLTQDYSEPLVQILNTKLRDILVQAGMVELGKSSRFFNKKAINDYLIQDWEFKVWKGFMATIHRLETGLYLCVDVKTKVLSKGSLLEVMNRIRNPNQLIGRNVQASYGKYSTYKILKFTDKTPESTFIRDNQKITYLEYYSKYYGIHIKNTKQCLVLSVTRRGNQQQEVYLVPQLFDVTGTSDREKQNFRLNQSLAVQTRISPNDRMKEESCFVMGIPKNEMFSVGHQQKSVEGNVMDKPRVVIKDDRDVKLKNDGTFLLEEGELLKSMNLKNWILIFSDSGSYDLETCDRFLKGLRDCAKRFKIQIPKPIELIVKDGELATFEQKLRRDFKQNGNKNTDIVVVLLKRKEEDYYGPLKRLLCTEIGLPSQMVLASKMDNEKKLLSICTGILLQMNVKMNCPLWKVITSVPALTDKRVIVGGMALFHKLVTKNESCCAFVGSLDNDNTSFYNCAKLVPSNQQRFESIKWIINEWVKTFCKSTRNVPDYIFLYREGVGESRIQSLLENEVKIIKEAVETIRRKMKLKEDKQIGIAFIAVNRKGNQRIYEIERSNSRDRSKGVRQVGNPVTGSVVGAGMSKGSFDFLMSPHNVTQGTCTPSHFNVIYNSTDLGEDEFMKFTFQNCYRYSNWRGPVRVPSVLQYANKYASLVGDSLKTEVIDPQLTKSLFYM